MRPQRTIAGAAVACLVLTLGVVSCRSGPEGGGERNAPAEAQVGEDSLATAGPATEADITPAGIPKPAIGGHAGVRAPIDAALVSRLLGDPETSDHVRRVVEDGVITFAEYEASVFGFMACMEGHGFTSSAEDLKLNVRGVYSYRITRPTDPNVVTEDDRQARAIEGYTLLLACQAEAFGGDLIDYWWKRGVWPSEQELQAAMDELVECLEGGGLGPLLPATRTYDEFANNMHRFLATADEGVHAVFLGCARRVQDDWGLIGFVIER